MKNVFFSDNDKKNMKNFEITNKKNVEETKH